MFFIGVGTLFATSEYYHSNIIIVSESGRKLLVDCGSDIRFSLAEHNMRAVDAEKQIDAVYFSHLHSDHIGGLEWLAFSTYFGPKRTKCKLFGEERLMRDLWEHSLKGGLEHVQGRGMTLEDYFECHPVSEGGSFHWEGISFNLVKMPHVISSCNNYYSYGLMIKSTYNGQAVFISTDTQFQPELLADIAGQAAVIFHDCETTSIRTTVHAHYNELCTLPASIKKKMWLYHYAPDHNFSPLQDGFRGFIRKGQEFDFS